MLNKIDLYVFFLFSLFSFLIVSMARLFCLLAVLVCAIARRAAREVPEAAPTEHPPRLMELLHNSPGKNKNIQSAIESL
jgi:hypothetical protein